MPAGSHVFSPSCGSLAEHIVKRPFSGLVSQHSQVFPVISKGCHKTCKTKYNLNSWIYKKQLFYVPHGMFLMGREIYETRQIMNWCNSQQAAKCKQKQYDKLIKAPWGNSGFGFRKASSPSACFAKWPIYAIMLNEHSTFPSVKNFDSPLLFAYKHFHYFCSLALKIITPIFYFFHWFICKHLLSLPVFLAPGSI